MLDKISNWFQSGISLEPLVLVTSFTIVCTFTVFTVDFLYKFLASNELPPENIVNDSLTELMNNPSREDLLRFISFNLLDLIFQFNQEQIYTNFRDIINDESFFKLIKSVFSDGRVATLSMENIKGIFHRGELLDFFIKLDNCDNFEDFKKININRRIVRHLIFFIKDSFNI